MASFKVDRTSLPRFWEKPLAFEVQGEGLTVIAEIDRDGATAYRWERQGGGMLLANTTTETFIAAVEGAVEARYRDGRLVDSGTICLMYDELYPPAI